MKERRDENLDDEMLTAYFDGELSLAEQLQVEQVLFRYPEAARALRQWGQLRLTWPTLAEDPAVADVRHRLGQSIRQRISQTMADGDVPWLAGADSQRKTSQTADSCSERADCDLADSGRAEWKSAGGVPKQVPQRLRSGVRRFWWGGNRGLRPAERLQRSAWQMGTVATVAVALLVTVWFSRPPIGGDRAVTGFRDQAEHAATDLRADRMMSAIPGARSRPEVVEPSDEPRDDWPALHEYTGIVVYDVLDPLEGLRQMQVQLEAHHLDPVQWIEDDGAPAVVLTGDLKSVSDLLHSFQSAGNHSLAFMSKIGPAGHDLDDEVAMSLGREAGLLSEAVTESPAGAETSELVLADSGQSPQPGQDQRMAARAPTDADTRQAEEVVESPVAAAEDGRPHSLGNQVFSRDAMIMSQVNLWGNSVSQPPETLTFEEFFRRPVPRSRADRVPYPTLGDATPSAVGDQPGENTTSGQRQPYRPSRSEGLVQGEASGQAERAGQTGGLGGMDTGTQIDDPARSRAAVGAEPPQHARVSPPRSAADDSVGADPTGLPVPEKSLSEGAPTQATAPGGALQENRQPGATPVPSSPELAGTVAAGESPVGGIDSRQVQVVIILRPKSIEAPRDPQPPAGEDLPDATDHSENQD